MRPRETSPELNDSEPRRVRPRTAGPDGGTLPLSPRRAMSGDMAAGPSSLAPRGTGSPRPMLLDLNASPPGSPRPMLPDLNVGLPGSPHPMLLDLNASPPGSRRPMLPDLNVGLPASPQLPDLNAIPPRSPRPDLLQLPGLPDTVLAAFGIRGEPQAAHLFLLVDQVAQHPELELNILRAAGDLLVELDDMSELLDGFESRYPHADPVTERVIEQLMTQIEVFGDIDSDQENDAIDGLEADLAQQNAPLGNEIQAWLRGTGTHIGSTHAFDDDENAPSFARMLSRLREENQEGTSATAERMATQVSSVIRAIAGDAGLRAQVFSIAETALGSCGDNLAEGFSNVLLAVRNHQMAQDVESGQVNAAQLNRWAGQQFRLSRLEDAVNRFITQQLQRPDLPAGQRNALTREPLETMVHAKVALRDRLDLPDSTVSAMRFRGCSVLGQKELHRLEQEVAKADRATHDEFLLGNPTWRAGMKALHAPVFEQLGRDRDADPFFDLDVPPDTDLEGQVRYAELAREVEAKWKRLEDELLRRLGSAG